MRAPAITRRLPGRPFGRRPADRPRGFTLVELLVTVGILLLVTGLTVAVVNVTLDGDRLRGASRQLQSYLEGARDRAIYADEPRGVRFILNPDDPSAVASMLLIGAPANLTEGTVDIDLMDGQTLTEPAIWTQLRNRGMLVDGARIEIAGDGTIYTMAFNPDSDGMGTPSWQLTKPYPAPAMDLAYEVELAPAILPNQEPRLLPEGVVIDLDQSRLPAGWGTGVPYASRLDILFSPRGTVTGEAASAGRVHFVLAQAADVVRNIPAARAWQPNTAYAVGNWLVPDPLNFLAYQCTVGGTSGAGPGIPPQFAAARPGDTFTDGDGLTWECFAKKENLVVSLSTKTGQISSHPIWDNRTVATDPLDPFRYAETGEVAR